MAIFKMFMFICTIYLSASLLPLPQYNPSLQLELHVCSHDFDYSVSSLLFAGKVQIRLSPRQLDHTFKSSTTIKVQILWLSSWLWKVHHPFMKELNNHFPGDFNQDLWLSLEISLNWPCFRGYFHERLWIIVHVIQHKGQSSNFIKSNEVHQFFTVQNHWKC